MANQLRIDGLADLRAQLMKLPSELVGEASTIVIATVQSAQRLIAAAYPVRNYGSIKNRGNLRRGLVTGMRASDRGSASAVLRSTAHHAHLYESGTVPRQWKGKDLGSMPAKPTFVPIVVWLRPLMEKQLIALVERAGLKVTAA